MAYIVSDNHSDQECKHCGGTGREPEKIRVKLHWEDRDTAELFDRLAMYAARYNRQKGK